MSVYFFTLSTGEKLCNGQGTRFVNDAAAEVFAVSSARAMMSDDVATGLLRMDRQIDVSDESGTVRLSVRFGDALRVTS